MNCEEFKLQIKEHHHDDSELEAHIESCPACCAWLNKEIEAPPQGLTPAEWQAATARCFPEIKELVAKEEPETFWSFYLTGLKYGAVFGLSIVTGFALLSLREEPLPKYDLNHRETMSFVDREETTLRSFVEKDIFSVTFVADDDSELVSFVEKVEMIDFIEESKEEESWEEQSG